MKRLVVVPAVLLTLAAVPVVTSAPAHAKGPTDVIVSGPGIEAVVLTGTRRGGDVDVWTLAEATSLFQTWGTAQVADRPPLTRAELGPRYELTWYVLGSVMSKTHAYPFASGGARAHVPGEMRSWVRGGPDLERGLVELGAERVGDEAEPASTSSTAVGSSATAVRWGERVEVEQVASSMSLPLAGGAVLAALALLLIVATVWMVRRRRTPQPA